MPDLDKTVFLPAETGTWPYRYCARRNDYRNKLGKTERSGGYADQPTWLAVNLTGLVQVSIHSVERLDNNDATVFDIVRVSVLPANFTPPTVDAGADVTITLPVNSVNLTGTATASTGTITSILFGRRPLEET